MLDRLRWIDILAILFITFIVYKFIVVMWAELMYEKDKHIWP